MGIDNDIVNAGKELDTADVLEPLGTSLVFIKYGSTLRAYMSRVRLSVIHRDQESVAGKAHPLGASHWPRADSFVAQTPCL